VKVYAVGRDGKVVEQMSKDHSITPQKDSASERTQLKDPGPAIVPEPPSTETKGIGWAVKQMHNGARVCRAGWNGKNMWLALQVPDAHSKMSLPYVYMKTADDKLVPWLCSQTDLLALDWEVVGKPGE
jgi:hypothetical protein